jgi:hypothetical protein
MKLKTIFIAFVTMVVHVWLSTGFAGDYHRAPLSFTNGWSINDQGKVSAGAREWKTEPGNARDTYTYLDPDKTTIKSTIQVTKTQNTITHITQSELPSSVNWTDPKWGFTVTHFRANGSILAATKCDGAGDCTTANNLICQRIARQDAMENFLEFKPPSNNFSEIEKKMSYCVELIDAGLDNSELRDLKRLEEESGRHISTLQGPAKTLWQDLKGDVKLHATSQHFSNNNSRQNLRQISQLI